MRPEKTCERDNRWSVKPLVELSYSGLENFMIKCSLYDFKELN